MPPLVTVSQHGLRELERKFKEEGPKANREMRKKLRSVAEPLRVDAQDLAERTIPRIGPKWGKMRVGVTTKAIYVAPVQRGVRTRGDTRRRPNLADLIQTRAFEPALEKDTPMIVRAAEQVLDELADEWNRI
jgi:hypothetical protein